MNALEAYEHDIDLQRQELLRVIDDMKNNIKDYDAIFTGSGDSYAAALLAVYASKHRARFIDPLELAYNTNIARGCNLYIISISGSTNANISAAYATKGISRRVAITANPNSRLAEMCDDIILLKYKHSNVLTAGSIGFSASVIAVLSIIDDISLNSSIDEIFHAADEQAEEIMLNNHIYTIGFDITYPLAIYTTAKVYEVLGYKAQYCSLEQFCHMEIFSLNAKDTVLLLADNDKARMLYDKLACNKYLIKPYSSSMLDNVLYYTFLIQLVVLKNAKRLDVKDCYFAMNEEIRNISSSLIY